MLDFILKATAGGLMAGAMFILLALIYAKAVVDEEERKVSFRQKDKEKES